MPVCAFRSLYNAIVYMYIIRNDVEIGVSSIKLNYINIERTNHVTSLKKKRMSGTLFFKLKK